MKTYINIPKDVMEIIEDDDLASKNIELEEIRFNPIEYQIDEVVRGEIRGYLLYQNTDDDSVWGIKYTEENDVIYFKKPRLVRMKPKKVIHYIQA